MYIRATQIQCPGNIVESRHQHTIGMLFTQCLTDTGDLFAGALTRIFQREYLHRILRNVRTILPDQLQGLIVRTEGDTALFTEVGNQVLHIAGRTAPAVDAHLCTSPTLTTDPLHNRRCTLYLQFHQLKLRSLQLLFCCQKITRIGPKGSRRHRHHRSTCRTASVFSRSPILSSIGLSYSSMRITTFLP